MTASRMWALIVGLIACGGGLVGAVYYHQQHPDAEIAKLVTPLTPPAPSEPAALPGGPDVPRPEAAKPEAATPQSAKQKLPPEPESGNGEPPHFDVVRVEPTGDAVLAGKGDPNAKVALVEQGKVLAETKADPSGHFVLLPPSLKPGDHDLTLRQTSEGKPAEESKQNVAVSVPPKGSGQVVVALAEPGKPTKVLSVPEGGTAATANAPPAPTPPEAAAPPPSAPEGAKTAVAEPQTAVVPPAAIAPKGPDLAIRTAELENGNGFYATGVAAPGTPVEVYLNGAHLAQVQAGPDGQWSVTVKKGLTSGHYAVRADAIDADHKVIARVEVPFDVPVAMANAAEAKADTLAASPKVAGAEPDATQPPSAPNPDDPSPSVSAAPEPGANQPSVVPTPRPDIAAAAKAASQVAPDKAPPALAVSPPDANPPASAPGRMAVAPAKPADAPPAMTSMAPSAGTPTPETPKTAGANAVIEQVETALVVRGDNLWNISRAKLGRGMRYTQIYAVNTSQIRNPRLIFPGQVFVLPRN